MAKATLPDMLLAVEVDTLGDKLYLVKNKALVEKLDYTAIEVDVRSYAPRFPRWTPRRLYTHLLTDYQCWRNIKLATCRSR